MDPGPGKAATRAKGGSQGAQCSVLCRWQRPQPSAAPAPASSEELEPFEALEPGEGDGIWLGTTGTMCCMYSTCHAAHTPRHCNSKGPLRSLVEGDSPLEHRLGTVRLGAERRAPIAASRIPVLGLLGLLGPRHPPSSWRSPRRDATRSPEAEPEGRRSSPWALMALIPKGEKRARDSGTPDPPLELAGRGSLLLRVTQSPRKP